MATTPYVVVNIPKASPEEADAGTNDNGFVTPLGLTAFHEGHIASEAQALAGTDNDTIMTPLRVSQVLDDRLPGFGTRNDAAALSIPASFQDINVTGLSVANTAPTHRYVRATSQPVCPISFRSVDRYLPNGTVSPSNGGYWVLNCPSPLISTMAGSKGDGVTNDRIAIQSTIDTYLYAETWGVYPASDGAYIAFGRFVIDEPLHVGWGDGPKKGVLKGTGSSYASLPQGTTILPNFSDAPVINVQSARRSIISGLSISGPNYSYLLSNNMGTWNPFIDDRVADNWWSGSLSANGDSRYAPMCGVGVDSYSGVAPSPSYPAYSVPSYISIPGQYGLPISSNVTIEDMDILGASVGVAVHASDSNANGDFVKTNNLRIAYCQYGISIGNTQSRNMTVFETIISNVYTGFTTATHGPQSGRIGEIIDCQVGNSINIFELCQLGINGPCNFRGLYTELCWRIGIIYGSSSSASSVTFDGCHISIDAQSVSEQILYAGSAKKGVPAACLQQEGASNTIIWIGGSVVGYHRVLTITNGNPVAVSMSGTRLEPGSAPASLYEKIALHSSCGGLVLHNFGGSSNSLKSRPDIRPKWTGYDTSGNALGQVVLAQVWRGSRENLTPIYAARHAGSSDSASQGLSGETSPRVSLITLVASSPSSVSATASLSGLTLTLTFSGREAWRFMVQGFDVGDILYHSATGSTFFVSARVGDVVTAVLQNNFEDPGTGYVPIDAITLTSGLMYCANSRLYTPASLYFGDFEEGSAIITNVVRWNGTCAIEADIADGDYLATALEQGFVTTQASGFVSSRSTAGKTITLAGAAAATQERVPLWNVYRSL